MPPLSTPIQTDVGCAPPGSGVVAVGLSSIPQKHGGALLAGGVPGHKGANQYTDRQRAQELRGAS